MFESEDFDLDEDFLKDICEKEEKYYSQKIDADSDPPTKIRKTESPRSNDLVTSRKKAILEIFKSGNDPSQQSKTQISSPDWNKTEKSPHFSKAKLNENEIISRKKLALEIFKSANNDASQQNKTTISSPNWNKSEKSLHFSKRKSNENAEISCKTLAHEIARKGAAYCEKNQSDENDSISRRTSPLKQISSDGERNKHIDNCDEEARRKRIFEIFKKPAFSASVSPRKHGSKSSPKFSSKEKRSTAGAPRMTLVRKFPGPAGLLPDGPETPLDHANFLNRSDDYETSDDHDDSGIGEYCSQDTERMFSVGAWRSMLDDLPNDFLKGHEIATIKKQARNNLSCGGNTRLTFLAGVIQRIDHSVENPRVVLKDLSDSIEGTMHGDIPLAHPNILEPGVVILLRNSGLLRFQGSQKCHGLQFHVMIAPNNVLAVYTEKSRLVTSPWMNTIVGNFVEKTDDRESNNPMNTMITRLPKKSLTTESNIEMSDFASEANDSTFARFDIDDIEDSQMADRFPNDSAKITEIVTTDGNGENERIERDILSLEDNSMSKKSLDNRVHGKYTSENVIDREAEKSGIKMKIEIKPKNIVPVRSRLLQFRSKDVLTPQINEERNNVATTLSSSAQDVETPVEISTETNDSNYRGFGEDLLDSDNDTDDEILSQLDVDSIVTSYNLGT